jgi:hypothetical protein
MAGKRRVLITIPTPDYKALEALARAEDRTPDQHAAYLLKQLVAQREAGRALP